MVCPDSFKGSLKAQEAADVIADALKEKYPDAEILKLPLADGGEGTGDLLAQGEYPDWVEVTACNPLKRPLNTGYHSDRNKTKAFIESAKVIGLPLLTREERNVMKASTFGLGMVIKKALENGCKEITVSLGGSATCDGGMGMLEALGYEFYDRNGIILEGSAENLSAIERIKSPETDSMLKGVEFKVLYDVENKLIGEYGSAKVYAPQKGAGPEDVRKLEAGLENLVNKAESEGLGGEDCALYSGAGAAGGLGFAFYCFLKAASQKGIEFMFEVMGFEEKIKEADLIITGEGKLDSQSLQGKVISGVLESAKTFSIPVIALAGIVESEKLLKSAGLKEIFQIADPKLSLEENLQRGIAVINLERAVRNEVTGWWEEETNN